MINRKRISHFFRIIYFSIFLNLHLVYCQPTFVKAYNNLVGASMRQTSDSGFIMAGANSAFSSTYQIVLSKLNSDGVTQWTKQYDGDTLEWAEYMEQTRDGGYLLSGRTNSFGNGKYDIYVIKTDSLGDTLWTRTYGGPQDEFSRYCHELKDGGFIIMGSGFSFGTTGSLRGTIYVIRTDSGGNMLWNKIYDVTTQNYLMLEAACPTFDDGFIIAGRIWGSLGERFYLLKIDSLGNIGWDKYYGLSNAFDGRAYGVTQTSDKGFVMAGYREDLTSSSFASYFDLIKTDSLGNVLWDKVYGDTTAGQIIDFASSVYQTADGGLMASGITWSFGSGQMYLIKTDANGQLQWSHTYGGSTNSSGDCIAIPVHDKGFLIGGVLGIFGSYPFNLIKTDSLGNPGCYTDTAVSYVYSLPNSATNANTLIIPGNMVAGTTTTDVSSLTPSELTLCSSDVVYLKTTKSKMKIYPNPAGSFFTIEVEESSAEIKIEIYDPVGKVVYSQSFNGKTVSINNHLKSGMYYLKVISTKGSFVDKLIVE